MNFEHKFRLIIYNLPSRNSGFGVSRTMEGRKTPLLFAGASTPWMHRSSMHPGKNGEQKACTFSWKLGEIKGIKIKLLKHIFVLYSFPIIFSTIFSLANTRWIAFYGKHTFAPPPRTEALVLATFNPGQSPPPPICFRLLDVQFRCTFLKVLKTEHSVMARARVTVTDRDRI